MREELQALKEQALAELGAVTTPDELKDLRIKYLGKKGPMTEILRGMGALPAEERPKIGQIVNEVKSALETAINAKTEVLEAESLKARLANEKVDITLPGRTQNCGHLHPVTLTLREIKKIFMRIDSFFTVFKFQPRNAEIINLVLLRRGEVTFDIYKTAPAFEFGQNVFITQIGKNPCQLNGRLLRV